MSNGGCGRWLLSSPLGMTGELSLRSSWRCTARQLTAPCPVSSRHELDRRTRASGGHVAACATESAEIPLPASRSATATAEGQPILGGPRDHYRRGAVGAADPGPPRR